MITCVVIDDEQSSIDDITILIENLPMFKIVKSFTNPLEALNYFKSNELDLVFIDVDMPLLNGVELSKLIRSKTKKLVFTTSHSKYALDAFKVSADDFLLKPFSFAEVLKTTEKLFPESALHTAGKSKSLDDFLYIKNKEANLKLIKVDFDDIVAIESLLNYVRIHTLKNKLVTHISLKEAKEVFRDRPEFVQLHRSFIISKKHISIIDGNTLTMSSGAKFTIGDSYRDILSEFVSKKMFKPISKK
ncbi:LytTR family DNA-binding domain-containing protein [Pedobacter sp. Leaf194]|uniref:LytR/AlgR family response regulator transcription factor n=1 Tax=Pedobacter sp. Leaf194 TaxID=1736297 RepID=UPI000703AE17|nr:LytTR family DNA-binding domain-containing protein [Pedobacter sp. Leaf194]KQS36819.1 hypothetical protein ASG14_07215 [Pedobacter sp. Leaf194]